MSAPVPPRATHRGAALSTAGPLLAAAARPTTAALLLAAAVPTPAAAAPARPADTLPGRRLALPRCTPAPDAACWELAPVLDRFVPGTGLLTAPAAARLRLAWSEEGLLLRVDALPPQQEAGSLPPLAEAGATAQVELALGDARRSGLISRAEATRTNTTGITLLPTPLTLGEERDLWANLVVHPERGGRAALPWSPAGELAPWRPAEVVLVERPELALGVELERTETAWRVEAFGASRITIRHEREAVPWGSRGMPAPWSAEGADLLEVPPPPDTGWYTLDLTWTDGENQPLDVLSMRVWHEAAAPPPGLIWPPPQQAVIAGDIALDLSAGAVVCGPVGPGRLLAAELTRFTGAEVWARSEEEGAQDCDVRLTLDGDLGEEAFAISVEAGRARVRGGDLLGLTYGALALADAVGPDGTAPTMQVADAPAIAERPLFHSIQVNNRPDLRVEDYLDWVHRVVLRARYDALHIMLSDGLAWETEPGLASRRAWTKEELRTLDAALEAVGMELVPGVNAPGHTGWILNGHPELIEDVNRNLLDTRHPDARPLLDALWTEAWESFGTPPALHIGHDEAIWQSDRWFGDERNPRTAASPRWFVLADDLRWHLDWCRARGLRPYLWSDLLLQGWNGAKDGGHKVLDLLTDAERAEMIVMAWSPLGDPLEHLLAQRGIRVMRVHTGYLEWKRAGLDHVQDRLAGEGLGLFQPAPWAAFGPAPGTRPLHYHLGATLLAGATAWRPALVHTHIEPTLGALIGHPATRPGLDSGPLGRARPVRISGPAPTAALPAVDWPARIESDALRIPVQPAVAQQGQPVEILPRRGPAGSLGLTLLHATELAHDAENVLRHDLRRANREHAAWHLEIEWEDGERRRLPMVYGLDTYGMTGDHRGDLQWGVADTVQLGSPSARATTPQGAAPPGTGAPAAARDRRVFRTDWPNPRPAVEIRAWRVVVDRPGVAVIVAGAVGRTQRAAAEPGQETP